MKSSVVVWLLAMFFALWETAHFGWNWTAHSDVEIICDGIAVTLFALACLTSAVEPK